MLKLVRKIEKRKIFKGIERKVHRRRNQENERKEEGKNLENVFYQ